MPSTRREFGRTLVSGTAAPPLLWARTNPRPNVVLILADQWSALAAPRTPAIAELASVGASFRESYCTYPLCSPSRASIFTGRMPHQTGVMANARPDSKPIPASVTTLGEVFSGAGYDTGYFGKEHIGAAGFRGFKNLGSIQYPRGGYIADGSVLDPVFVRDAVAFIRAGRDRPFLCVASLINPHDICYQAAHATIPVASIVDVCTGLWGGKYLNDGPLPPPRPNWQAMAPESIARVPRIQQSWGEKEWRIYLGTYFLLIENTDWLIGHLLEALRVAGIERQTIVLFTSDHGDQMGAHQLVGKGVFFEESMRVPFLLSWPGVIKPQRAIGTELVSGVDVLPTLCDYAGIAPPTGIPGRSVRPLLDGNHRSWRQYAAAETADGRMLRMSRYKYMSYRRPGNPEFLFDLERDPGETVNLAADPGARPTLEQARQLLARWMEESGGGFERTAGPSSPGVH